MLAKDIMRKRVITATPDMTVRELAKLFIDRQITGVPVVDRRGILVGVVSQTDLVRHEREGASNFEVPHYYRDPEQSGASKGFQVVNPDYTRVGDIMTPVVLSAEEDSSIVELGRFMLKKRIHRVVITSGGRLCGIVTSIDLIRGLLAWVDKIEPVGAK